MPRIQWQHTCAGNSGGLPAGRAFATAVYDLHATIMQPYRQWCAHVDAQPQPSRTLATLTSSPWASARAVNHLLHDLALWFLLWTEASSLRHMPEALWFVFHILQHSPAARACAAAGLPLTESLLHETSSSSSGIQPEQTCAGPDTSAASARFPAADGSAFLHTALRVREDLQRAGIEPEAACAGAMPWHQRATCQYARSSEPHDAAGAPCACHLCTACAAAPCGQPLLQRCRLLTTYAARTADPACQLRCADALAAQVHTHAQHARAQGGHATPPDADNTCNNHTTDSTDPAAPAHQNCSDAGPGSAESDDVAVCAAGDGQVLLELLQRGDGGQFLEGVVEPFFLLAAREVSQKYERGVPVHQRLGYDDINESFCMADRVHAMLRYLHKNGRCDAPVSVTVGMRSVGNAYILGYGLLPGWVTMPHLLAACAQPRDLVITAIGPTATCIL